VQTNLQQVDVNKFTFQLDDAENINHIVVFLLGTVPFQQGFAATVHLLWPNKTWQLLGMLANDKPSAIFRLKAATPSKQHASFTGLGSGGDMAMDQASSGSSSSGAIVATLGISIEPIDAVLAQVASRSSSASTAGSNPTAASSAVSVPSDPGSALVPLPSLTLTASQASPDSVAVMAQKVMTHLYNHVTSYATATLPPGSTVLVPTGGPGSAANVLASAGSGPESSYLPVRAFNDWYQNVVRKARVDPTFLARD
ncbi:hypothetical protein BGZ99_001637, partial [Dissophora globulifera]